ncbi:hypothetical protein MGG_15336 [Pyricularia oryzae 70-15]|uniref:Secreted protein n=2 Tax=Pyricularia oryzae TaxID=318829 RepID=G4MX27_PYRO7|nr:uncharacterized protein MGG_15336 [Pyricularia oryzae 70-15]EHA55125.1 hypothetical protein MGG_15336 [Pyricularia oryzae 70-15]KAI7908798.1 hypothetical protein M0657_012130 [Pyricularia oryzae]QBZ66567.1 hypothetical protein PoMZ_13549 [Pyricularia oryzae]
MLPGNLLMALACAVSVNAMPPSHKPCRCPAVRATGHPAGHNVGHSAGYRGRSLVPRNDPKKKDDDSSGGEDSDNPPSSSDDDSGDSSSDSENEAPGGFDCGWCENSSSQVCRYGYCGVRNHHYGRR